MMSGRKKILIVDDSETDREVLKNILRSDYTVLEANGGFAAMNIITEKKNELDAILLDISMPVLNGFSILENMRDRKIRGIRIFMITSEATKDNVEKAAGYHVTGFIRKPFDAEDVLKRIEEKLDALDGSD